MSVLAVILNEIAAVALGYLLAKDGVFDRKPKRRYRYKHW